MSYINNRRKRPKIRKKSTLVVTSASAVEDVKIVEPVVDTVEEIVELVDEPNVDLVEAVVEETIEEVVEAVDEDVVEEITEDVEEAAAEDSEVEIVEDVDVVVVEDAEEDTAIIEDETCEDVTTEEEIVEEVVEELDEVPLEASEDEIETVLDEEASLDGDKEDVDALVAEDSGEDELAVLDGEETVCEEEIVEDAAEEVVEETVEEVVETVDEDVAEEIAEEVEEDGEDDAAEDSEEVVEDVKAKKEEFKLTAPENLSELLSKMCTKRARKLIYRPGDIIFAHTTKVLGTDKNNDEKIKIKNILDAEIKQGVKLGYLDKFDGLKMSEIKEEYENDIVYEYADQEFKRTGILLDGDKVKVYIYDWDMKACHHVGYIDDESAELVKPYILESEKYSFDINGIIVGGKYRKVIKDEKTGKITVEKGNDGNLGLEIDINIINRKD